jgi:hypothetical protein
MTPATPALTETPRSHLLLLLAPFVLLAVLLPDPGIARQTPSPMCLVRAEISYLECHLAAGLLERSLCSAAYLADIMACYLPETVQ